MASLRVTIQPVPKPRQTRSDKWKQRPCVVAYRAFADLLRLEAKKQDFQLGNNLHYTFFLPMPKSWSKQKQAERRMHYHDQRPDLDNLLKAVWDALAKEDKAIASIASAKKLWDVKPGIFITSED